ncbi:DUF6452 family protein [Psychroflexus tropicus]|uniref:DUF6452 family protein n=1 Tax=Psychroflexus tropicus TaxID=197345 RepID=UPI000371167A|nr:DUF6452 family protein [Psychroflexus tropicus]
MKKTGVNILSIAFLISLLISCERDDICAEATPTTPQLVIEFFSADNPGQNRNVNDLAVIDFERQDTLRFPRTSNISIPLKTNEIETKYIFNINSNDESGGRIDTLTFSYATEELYVNRACGFKVNFIDFRARQQNNDNPLSWIRDLEVNENIIRNESETHLSITY